MSFLNLNLARFSTQITSPATISRQYFTRHIRKFGILQNQISVRPLTRSLVVLSSSNKFDSRKSSPSILCSCGCGIHGMHTKGDREIVEFLQSEIIAEKKQQTGSVPSHLDDFSIKQDKAELLFTKKFHDEDITISLNVNHTVDTDTSAEDVHHSEESGPPTLKSKPDFDVDIKIGKKILSFTCQFTSLDDIAEGETVQDTFGISEVTIYEGEWEEKTYCVSGDVLDGTMYDLFMNMLSERGVTDEFVMKLSDVSTSHEHGLYIGLLEHIENFVRRK